MAMKIVDFPIKNGDFPWQNVSSPEGSWFQTMITMITINHKPYINHRLTIDYPYINHRLTIAIGVRFFPVVKFW